MTFIFGQSEQREQIRKDFEARFSGLSKKEALEEKWSSICNLQSRFEIESNRVERKFKTYQDLFKEAVQEALPSPSTMESFYQASYEWSIYRRIKEEYDTGVVLLDCLANAVVRSARLADEYSAYQAVDDSFFDVFGLKARVYSDFFAWWGVRVNRVRVLHEVLDTRFDSFPF